MREDQLRREVARLVFEALARRLGVHGQHGQWARVGELVGVSDHNMVAYRRGRDVSLGYLLRLAERHGLELTINVTVKDGSRE